MALTVFRIAASVIALLPTGLFAQTANAGATIDINAGHIEHPIPETIFGTFLEPIGHSVYGGLWSEIIQNPSFEQNLWSAAAVRDIVNADPDLLRASGLGLPLPWEPLDPKHGNRYETHIGDAANSGQSLLIMGMPDRVVGIRQKIYLPVHRINEYSGFFYARAPWGPVNFEIGLRSRATGMVLSTARGAATATAWSRYRFDLNLNAGSVKPLESIDFYISLPENQRVLIDEVSLMPRDNLHGLDPDIVALSREMKTPLVRFGGNFTSSYHWRDGIGARDKRVSMLNLAWGMPEYNSFGTDEFLDYCRMIGAQPQIALNLGSGTAQEAADWVRYVNENWGDHQGGLLWELGNELWGDWNAGYPTYPEIAGRTLSFSNAVRGVDPHARLIATGQDPDVFEKWDALQLSGAKDAFDFLSTHFVVGDDRLQRKDPSAKEIAEAAFALPLGLERRLQLMAFQISAFPWARNHVRIAFTEWLFHSGNPAVPRYDNMGGAICTAGFLNMLMRSAESVPISDMTGILEFGGIWKKKEQAFGTPAYWAFRTYSALRPANLVTTRTDVESYSVEQGNVRIPAIPDVPYLDAVSALDGGGNKLLLFCVNRDLNRSFDATLKITGFDPAQTAMATEIRGLSAAAANSEETPDLVKPISHEIKIGTRFRYTFAPASVTVMEIPKAN